MAKQAWCAGVLLLSGCVGTLGDGTVSDLPPVGQLALTRVRRMTRSEYLATLNMLLGDNAPNDARIPSEARVNGYDNDANSLRVDGTVADSLFRNGAEWSLAAADWVLANGSCAPSGTADPCVGQLLSDFATRAYRRPITDQELEELRAVYQVGIDGEDLHTGLATALSVVLQSPDLLYRTELGADGATGQVVTLTPFEVADQLAFTLTGAPADEALLADAKSAAIMDGAVRRAQAERLLATAAARDTMGDFAERWLELIDLGTTERVAPEWSPMRASALAETRSFYAAAVLDENYTLGQVFEAEWTVGDDVMASFYGATREGDRLLLPTEERRGILTQAAVIARHSMAKDSAPVHRGKLIRARMFCQTALMPPKNITITPPPDDPTLTTRERWVQLTADNPTCWGCHQQLDPIGYGFERYDAIGRFRTEEVGKTVDDSSTLAGTDVDGAFTHGPELIASVAQSADARQCFAGHWLEFALGRAVDGDTVSIVGSSLIEDGASIRDWMLDVIASDEFIQRARAN
jgi:Protein of unknown function (DUF1588)/Protein of unknown function (DUF1592)/Protein of unknown function (DUF1595)/Protein of unknown function (DUF1587)/Protein of unknown function (DUF1585)